jgi:hypothetical protein
MIAIMEHFKALCRSYPLTDSDYKADGDITHDAAKRVSTWAREGLSEAERTELDRQIGIEMAMGDIEELVKQGVFVKYADKVTGQDDLLAGAWMYGKDEKQTALIDELVAAGSHYRGQDDEETGEPRFFAIQREEVPSHDSHPD